VDLFHQELVDVFDSGLRHEIYNLDDDEQEVSSELDPAAPTDIGDSLVSKTTCELEDQADVSKLDTE
jgi:hypothetical protein